MASRRTEGGRKPPPRADTLVPEYMAAIDALGTGPADHRRQVDGRARRQHGRRRALTSRPFIGLLCLGYPFHPPGKPEQLRTAHLAELKTPTLIVQGTRDAFGTRDEVATYGLSNTIEILWLEDGDHDLKPRKSRSGFSADDHLRTLAKTVTDWANRIQRSS